MTVRLQKLVILLPVVEQQGGKVCQEEAEEVVQKAEVMQGEIKAISWHGEVECEEKEQQVLEQRLIMLSGSWSSNFWSWFYGLNYI